jgi:hypothetical protein
MGNELGWALGKDLLFKKIFGNENVCLVSISKIPENHRYVGTWSRKLL